MKLKDQITYEPDKRHSVQPTSLRKLPKVLKVEPSEIALEDDEI